MKKILLTLVGLLMTGCSYFGSNPTVVADAEKLAEDVVQSEMPVKVTPAASATGVTGTK